MGDGQAEGASRRPTTSCRHRRHPRDLLDPDTLAESAQRNFDVYGFYGVSVFAETVEVPWTDLAATRFIAVRWLVLFTAGDLQAAGLDVVHADLHELVARMLGTAHRVVPNPHYGTGG